LGSPLVALAIFALTWFFHAWQVRLEKQKLRHDLYERRFTIYGAFQDLLLALPGKHDKEIDTAFRKASIARLNAPFVLGDDPAIQAYLDQILTDVRDSVLNNVAFRDAVNDNDALKSDPQVVQDLNGKAITPRPGQIDHS
jgi:hypothetical protein